MELELKDKFLVCIDSDGCAIDSMTIKHEAAFGPAFVEVWNVPADIKDKVLKDWNHFNLYAMTRGINRFQGLVAILKMYPELDDRIEIGKLSDWTETTKALSPEAMKAFYDQTGLSIMRKALTWSDRVNAIIETLPLAQPFQGVKEAMQRIKLKAHIAVVSSANPAAIEEEWKTSGLYDMVDYFYSQVDGTKTECIRKLLEKGYQPNKTIMLGDALGDYKAAQNNDIWFYPILASKECESWRRFDGEYFDMFVQEQLNLENQFYWVNAMKDNLS